MMFSTSDSTSSGMMMLLLVLAATVIMVMLLRRYQFRSTSRRDMSRDHTARIRDQHKLRESMDELLIQLEEVSRHVGAQVDTKLAELKAVTRHADERIARLEDMLGQRGDETEPCERERDNQSRTQDEPGDPRFRRVYELVDAGAAPVDVAEQLGLPLGEVELLLNLRKFR